MIVGVIGSGTMGSGIAQVAATSGCQVKLYDTNNIALDKSKQALDKILSRLIEKGRIENEEKERIASNISYCSELKDLESSDLVIEAIIEDLDIKKSVFKELSYPASTISRTLQAFFNCISGIVVMVSINHTR